MGGVPSSCVWGVVLCPLGTPYRTDGVPVPPRVALTAGPRPTAPRQRRRCVRRRRRRPGLGPPRRRPRRRVTESGPRAPLFLAAARPTADSPPPSRVPTCPIREGLCRVLAGEGPLRRMGEGLRGTGRPVRPRRRALLPSPYQRRQAGAAPPTRRPPRILRLRSPPLIQADCHVSNFQSI